MNNALTFWNDSDFHNPWRHLGTWESSIDRLFDEALNVRGRKERIHFQPRCDVEETDSHYVISFDVPGISRKDINIEFRGNHLIVSGERQRESENKNTTQHSVERSYGKFERIFKLPTNVEADKIEAQHKDGVLLVAIPKAESTKPKKIAIEEGKASLFERLIGKKETKEVA